MLAYFPLLDALRFLAAVAVMCFHYFSAPLIGSTAWYTYPVQYGYLGVELFFIISGFVIYFSLKRPVKEYALGRFMRLYPLFWVLCTVTYILTWLFKNGDPLPFKYYLLNLFIVNNGQTAFMVDGSYWTLTIEIIFYVLIGLFVWLFSTKRLELFYAAWLIFGFAVFYFGFQDALITKVLLARYIPYFVFGGMLGLALERWKHSSSYAKARYLLLLGVSALMPLYISYRLQGTSSILTNHFGVFDIPTALFVESFFLVVPLGIYLSYKIRPGRLLQLAVVLGGITYPLYLLHEKIGAMIITTFQSSTFVAILVTIGMVGVSYVVYRCEKPLRKAVLKKALKLSFFKRNEVKNLDSGAMANDAIEAP